jgi:hypothetical protein
VAPHRFGEAFSLLRQGLELGVEYGTHSLEALLWVAETVEESIYVPGSLVRCGDGLSFSLDNPPLRSAAFHSVELVVDGRSIRPEAVELRLGARGASRPASDLSAERPLAFTAGDRLDVTVHAACGTAGAPSEIRLALRTEAVPPPVWIEFADTVREAPTGP